MITPFFLVLLAFLLRLPLISGSFWLDEAAQALESIRPLSEQLHIVDDFQPPLFHLIVHYFSLVSHAEWWLRIPSLAAGVATVLVLYLILQEKFGKKIAFIGGLLLATSPFHVFFSQELRPYALATFFATLSWYILISKACEKRRFVWFAIVSTFGLYTMYLYPFVLVSQGMYIVFEQRKSIRPFLGSVFAVAILFLPWLPTFRAQLQSGTTLTQALPGWSLAVATPQLKALPLIAAKFLVGQAPFRGNPLFVVLTAGVLFGVGILILKTIRTPKAKVFFYWLCVPILTAWLLSFVLPVIQAKRVMVALPAFVAFIAIDRQRFSKIVLILVVMVHIFSLTWYYSDEKIQREDWRTVVYQVEREVPPQSVALYSFPESFAPWRWYETKKVPSLATGTLVLKTQNDLSSVSSQLHSVTMVYLFDYLRDLTDPHHTIEAMLAEQGFEQVNLIDGNQVGFVRIFKKR